MRRFVLLLPLLLNLWACSGPQIAHDVDPGYDFSQLVTVGWSTPQSLGSPDQSLPSYPTPPGFNNQLQQAAAEALALQQRSLSSEALPRLQVSLMHLSQEERSSSRLGIGAGGGSGGIGLGLGLSIPLNTQPVHKVYLMVDLIDAQQQLLWRANETLELGPPGESGQANYLAKRLQRLLSALPHPATP